VPRGLSRPAPRAAQSGERETNKHKHDNEAPDGVPPRTGPATDARQDTLPKQPKLRAKHLHHLKPARQQLASRIPQQHKERASERAAASATPQKEKKAEQTKMEIPRTTEKQRRPQTETKKKGQAAKRKA
jgi:hypothetical protein